MRDFILKIFAVILISLLVLPYFNTSPANAQVKSIVNVTSCTAGGLVVGIATDKLSVPLDNLINKGLTGLATKLPGPVGSLLGLVGGAGGGVTGTVPVNDANMQSKWTNKESRMDIIARCFAREIYDKMVGNTLNVVRNHGRDGGPTFVKNWRNFITGSQYRGENVFRAILSNTKHCEYFSRELKSTFNADVPTTLSGQNTRVGDLDSFAIKAGCTLPNNWSMEEYTKDFSTNGGWAAFAKLIEPQNNALGSFLLAMDEAAKQRSFEEQLDLAEAGGGGGGYTSRRGRGAPDSCLVRASNNQCIAYKDILTPGSTLKGSIDATTQQEMAWITNVDELGEVISTLVGALLNRMLDLGNNNDSRPIDPADLPTYNNVPLNGAAPQLEGEQGPIEYPPLDENGQNPINGSGGSGLISGYVFNDTNRDGVLDAGEPLLSNLIVDLESPDGNTNLSSNQTFQGIYTFGGLTVGQDYRVTVNIPVGFARTNDDSVVISNVTTNSTKDFGIAPTP